jgi:phage terminase large subunit GpA-like protein
MITTKEPPAANKSDKPPITKKHKRRMADYLIGLVKSFPTKSVSEGVVEFSERVRVLTGGTSARPGPYRYEVTPYLREIADALSDDSTMTEGVCMKPTQWGFTDGVLMNHELYCIEYGIGPVLYVTSDDDLAGEHMEKRVDPMISAAGMLDKITPPVQKRANKSTGDTRRAKSYGGTFLRAIGARSESKLSSTPIRIVHLDEEDKYPLKLLGGGDPAEKAKRRADSYKGLKKIMHGSTPKLKGSSKIEPLLQQGDMRYYNYQCPECKTMQRLKWNQIEWDKNEEGKIDLKYDEDGNLINNPVWHNCINAECSFKMKDFHKVELLKEEGYGGYARWIPTKKTDRPGLRSWKGHGLEGFRSWVEIVLQWERIDGDPILLQDVVNDVFGESFEQKIDKPDEHYLASRAEADWVRGQVNERIKTLHLGADIHPDRIECTIMGYTDRKEAWAVDYHVFPGVIIDPNDKCWDSLEEVIKKEYHRTGPDGGICA